MASKMAHDVKGTYTTTTSLSKPAHSLQAGLVLDELSTHDQEGLSSNEAKARLEKHGRNELQGGAGVQPVKILLRQIANAMMLVHPLYHFSFTRKMLIYYFRS
jgi:magnesium-transporting ATPase (P-type)